MRGSSQRRRSRASCRRRRGHGRAVGGTVAAAPVPGTACEVFPADNVWNMDVSALPKHPKSRVWKRSSHAGRPICTPTSARRRTASRSTWSTPSHADVTIDFTYAERERRRSVPVRARHHDRGRVRPARADDRRGHLHALRAVRRALERRRPSRRQRRDLRSRLERPAACRVDERRRRGAADLPRARAVGRGAGGRDRPRDPVHGRLHDEALRLAGAPPGRRRATDAARRWAPGSG